ncbi:hypothetical protein SmJEL517_g04796 [Synchytrium microbalum]|uniref:Cytochrome b5 domain-containing protein 1 n=1 Tax=Synchytrium microbalum TaxID=1806994 RepID=A0A507BYM3_9FUNG|nr:uncharacterized protein SmJEL517_g04796 [Synchytrium microbalum]TPX31969.1 hypothetical protein SmJEL517_g04796 [Synchytrium microbalum]
MPVAFTEQTSYETLQTRKTQLQSYSTSAYTTRPTTAGSIGSSGEPHYFTPSEVSVHNSGHDLWISFLGRVYDLTSLYQEYKADPRVLPLLRNAGRDISHWFNPRTGEFKTQIHPLSNVPVPFTPEGLVPHIPPTFPSSNWNIEEAEMPWWMNDEQYCVGRLSSKTRKIRIVNTLTGDEDVLEVCGEESLNAIQDRYEALNAHARGYKWKRLGAILDMSLTLEGNGIADESARFQKLDMDDEHWLPAIHLYFADDLTVAYVAIWSYLIPILAQNYLLSDQDLKKRYGAKWALVTGGSSGIGACIVKKLASQGINVVVVALDNNLLPELIHQVKQTYPNVEFRSVGADLSAENSDTYMEKIKDATKDIEVQLVFNNAGYIMPGLFALLPLDTVMKNYHTNATSSVYITHHFTRLMIERKQKGLVEFTSSSASFMPSPTQTMYAPTKSFITNLGANLAAELREDGIDVVVMHPSPVNTNFFENAKGVAAVLFFKRHSYGPEVICDAIFASAGRVIIYDQGYFSISLKLLLKALDWNLLVTVFSYGLATNGDYKNLRAKGMAGLKK